MYHVTSRGNERRAIYRDDRDRQRFLSVVSSSAEECGWLVHAYCLMPNHYHLLVETPEPNISRGMKKVNGLYAQAFNTRYKRAGHVFHGRFHSTLVDKDRYLLRVSRYIVLNPVRAGLARTPEEWTWSSYRPMIGAGPRPLFLVCERILGYFGRELSKARKSYMNFVTGKSARDICPEELLGGVILGSHDFLSRIRGNLSQRESRELDRLMAAELRPDLKSLFPDGYTRPLSRETARRARQARLIHGYSYSQIARVLGIHHSTLSRAIRRQLGPLQLARDS